MNGKVWFGTKAAMQWVAAPAVDISAGKQGYSASASFINGGAWSRRSKTASKIYALSWNLKSIDDVQPILDYADGLYGNGYLYYVDPFTMGKNVFPSYWASPFMNAYDGPLLVDGNRPTVVDNGASTNGYPVESVQYTVTSTSAVPSIFLPIPEFHTLYIGAHGSVQSGNASVKVTPVIDALSTGVPSNLTLLNTTTMDRTNSSWKHSDGIVGVEVTLTSTSTGVIQLDGMIAQIAPDGAVLPSGGFISGSGTSGMVMAEQPVVSQYSAALDKVGVSVNLIETEAWTWR